MMKRTRKRKNRREIWKRKSCIKRKRTLLGILIGGAGSFRVNFSGKVM